jgi:antitoxin component HigA of HigAB toxin-antitoxin module
MLWNLINEYEVARKRQTKAQPTGLELLRAVTESSGMTQAELAKSWISSKKQCPKSCLGARSIVSGLRRPGPRF